ncbi:1,2-phenylacetyl-CoA epoxidase subunit PaaD [Ornithinimicrobium cavernae]|uniref:1,2-phenylacetyl-CoA epoxidase subunit PaaD n=1 Tax=Ornithinimicrobium cavernae TaxID=2666047 RepID=UPI001EFF8830|nr:1,2-phenylacetyl-CoA epoxidase subunit PaaD [Ornithinimicrobium cavernae]
MTVSAHDVERAVRQIPDPEIPVISIDDLGIVRDIVVEGDTVHVTITPTYSGCPAVQAITDHIGQTVRRCGMVPDVVTTLSPAWTTDWMSDRGRESLRRFGIAPPDGTGPVRPDGPVVVDLSVRRVTCPTCGSRDTEELSRFGSTACKALRRCRACREPFEEFKAI